MTEIDKPILGGGGSTQSNSIDPKTSVLSGYSLSTSAQTIVGAINEILPKVTGVGKVDPNSNGTGEVFNGYEGYYANVASGNYSHAEGGSTTASGYYSHAEGFYATASGDSSHAEGYNTNASGDYSHAEGTDTTASGNSSHAEGFQTNASGYSSHAEGYSSSARGEYSHAEGYKTKASGDRSHAEGNNTNASGYSSHAEGYYTQTFSWGEHAEGSYNKSYDSDDVSVRVIHSVGIGPSWDDRKNAHEIKFNGDHYIYGIGGYDGKNATANTSSTLQQIINSLFNITVDLRGYDSVMSNNGDGFKIADLSDQHYINGADIFIKDDDIEGEIKYFVVEKNKNMAEVINFNNGNTFEYTQEYGLKRNGDELVKVYARYGKYSTEEESKWWLMKITPASGGSN